MVSVVEAAIVCIAYASEIPVLQVLLLPAQIYACKYFVIIFL